MELITSPDSLPLTEEQLRILDAANDENVDARAELKISRIALSQALTPEVAQKRDGYTDGQYLDSVSRAILSKYEKPRWLIEEGGKAEELKNYHAMPFIPVMKLPTEYIHWKKRDAREDGESPYDWKTTDKNDPKVKAGVWPNRGGSFGTTPETKGKAPPVTDNINYLVLPFDYDEKFALGGFMILTFARTSVAAGKTLTTRLNELKALANIRSYQSIFFLYSKSETKGKNTYNISQVSQGKKRADEYVPHLSSIALAQAMWLADVTEGKARQSVLLSADIEDDAPPVDDHSGGGTVDGTASPSTDPFAPPPNNDEVDDKDRF